MLGHAGAAVKHVARRLQIGEERASALSSEPTRRCVREKMRGQDSTALHCSCDSCVEPAGGSRPRLRQEARHVAPAEGRAEYLIAYDLGAEQRSSVACGYAHRDRDAPGCELLVSASYIQGNRGTGVCQTSGLCILYRITTRWSTVHCLTENGPESPSALARGYQGMNGPSGLRSVLKNNILPTWIINTSNTAYTWWCTTSSGVRSGAGRCWWGRCMTV